ncbi:hypothetical protein [Streptosporangium sp. NPDC023615]|uniref:hypothetical protein n=1 Tax=Streptosporangium sp. NPDC023615 TaxID=3154794 RepID=UPI0034193481
MRYPMLVCTDPAYTPGQDDGVPDVEAIDVASRHPMAWRGMIELRPFWPDGED